MFTPWGPSQTCTTLGPGVVEVTTASHGGIHLDDSRNAHVHKAWRAKRGWYEEDCEWTIVAVTFPDLFEPEHVIEAHRVAKDWMPDQYEQVFQVRLLPAESHVRQEQIFYTTNADNLVVLAAWGHRNDLGGRVPVPAGQVGVVARIGGRGPGPKNHPERYFLVPEPEYDDRDRYGFVIDETRHAEWPALAAA